MTEAAASTGAPVLSILCLTYNHAAYIAQALDSFLAQQTRFEVEVVLSDDCSSDTTLDIVERYRPRFEGRLTVLRSPVNLGITRNFRRAMGACRGRYVAICEGDDYWRGTRKLQMQVDYLDAHPDCVLAFHNAILVNESGEQPDLHLPEALCCDASREQLVATRPIPTLTSCFRRVLPPLPGELDHAPALDLCLWSLLGRHGTAKFMADVEPAGYRVHAQGVFSTQTERNRHLMTAQTLLCLARVHAREGLAAESEQMARRASELASTHLGLADSLSLVVFTLKRLAYQALQGLRRGR